MIGEIELKPCPFCGGKAVLRTWIYSFRGGTNYVVQCNDCNATVPIWFETAEESVRQWNRRAENANKEGSV